MTVSLNESYSIEIRAANELDKGETDNIIKLLRDGGAVSVSSARREIPLIQLMTVVRQKSEIVGFGAIKGIREGYAESIQRKSNFHFDKRIAELGYVVVADGHQGHHLSSHIVENLVAGSQNNLFATTDSVRMQHCLKKVGFKKCGGKWKGNRNPLSLWLLTHDLQESE